MTLHDITLHYVTLHDITLCCIHMYIYIYDTLFQTLEINGFMMFILVCTYIIFFTHVDAQTSVAGTALHYMVVCYRRKF